MLWAQRSMEHVENEIAWCTLYVEQNEAWSKALSGKKQREGESYEEDDPLVTQDNGYLADGTGSHRSTGREASCPEQNPHIQ